VLGEPSDEARLQELLAAASTRWLGKPSSAAGQPIPAVLDFLEAELPGDRETVLARFSIADVALGAHLGWLAAAGLELDAKRWPRTARYRRALLARPSFKTVLAP
jgi:glutathione S-transferase